MSERGAVSAYPNGVAIDSPGSPLRRTLGLGAVRHDEP